MTKILITGINGLIGSQLSKELKKSSDIMIYGVSQAKNGNQIEIDFSLEWSEKDLPKEIDVIIHLAQSEKFRDFPHSSNEVFQVNTVSTLKLLEYARNAGASKFIYASSGGVYGNSDKGFSEESPLQPNKDLGFYLTTKFCSELIVENYSRFFDVNILRFFFVFGEEQRKNMLIPRLIDSVRNNKVVTLQGLDGIKINPIYVEDAAKAISKIISKPGSYNVNIGGTEILSIKQIVEMIGVKLKVQPIFDYQTAETKNLIGDISKMKELYEPQVNFASALNKMIGYE